MIEEALGRSRSFRSTLVRVVPLYRYGMCMPHQRFYGEDVEIVPIAPRRRLRRKGNSWRRTCAKQQVILSTPQGPVHEPNRCPYARLSMEGEILHESGSSKVCHSFIRPLIPLPKPHVCNFGPRVHLPHQRDLLLFLRIVLLTLIDTISINPYRKPSKPFP